MVTIPFWVLIALVQGLVLLTAATVFLAWRLRVARRTTDQADADAVSDEPASSDAIRTYLDQALEQTRLEQHARDRNVPDQVLETRLHYLASERDALDYANQADRFWAHLCDRIENGLTTPTEVDDDGSLETTHHRLRRILGQLEGDGGESQVTVRQLAVIERRLAALQRQEDAGSEEAPATPGATTGDETDDAAVPEEASTGDAGETAEAVADSAALHDEDTPNSDDTTGTDGEDSDTPQRQEHAGSQEVPATSDDETQDPAKPDATAAGEPREASDTEEPVTDSATTDDDDATRTDGEVKDPADDSRA